MRVKRADLGPLRELAGGAFAKVYDASSYRLPGDSGRIAYKEFLPKHAAEQARSAENAVSFRDLLSPADRAELDKFTVWPRAVVEERGAVVGLVMPLIPGEFFFPTPGRTTTKLRDLQWLIATSAQLVRSGIADVDETERLMLLGQLVYAIGLLHEHGWVYGDLSFKNAAFAVNPPRMILLDCDGAADIRDLHRTQSHSLGWDPPECAQGNIQDLATDVYKLGLAILRCLNPGKAAATMRDPSRVAGKLDAAGVDLVARAVDPDPARRPTAAELYAYLRGVVPFAQNAMMPPALALRLRPRPLAGVRSDAPSVEDSLGTGSDAETLADLIAATETAAPLAIALIGDWGSGKSSLMLQIQRRIDVLAQRSREDPGNSMFAANVRQVRFNAWDYSDDHVWVGIIEHLFGALAAESDIAASTADPEAARAERARLRQLLTDREAEERRLAEELRAADATATPPGYLAGLSSPARAARVTAAAVCELGRDVRSSWTILLGWAVLGGAAAGIWVMWGSLVGAAASAVAAVVSPGVAAARRLRAWHRTGTRIIDGQRSRLDGRQRRLQREITQTRERLAVADAAVRLSVFLTDRADGSIYGQYRSLLGRVRADLGQLSADLAQARYQWTSDGAPGLPPLERIVLYIDDLDRCPPRKVVEVLEAVHLMLALDLFVVVVAVDARWLIKSLQHHYRELFGSPAGQVTDPSVSGADSNLATPADYLDKIFQIPFALTPPSQGALSHYLRSLLPLPPEPKPEPNLEPSEGMDADNDETGTFLVSAEQETQLNADGTDTGQAPVSQPSISDIAAPELRPSSLHLTRHEVESMALMSALLPTPRAAKKLVNLYRLVRIGVSETELTRFVGTGSGGAYQVVQIILAMLVSSPDVAQEIFQHIMNAAADESIIDILRAIRTDSVQLAGCIRMAALVAAIAEQNQMLADIREYQRWCPALARYSFHTRNLTNASPPAPARRPDADSPVEPARPQHPAMAPRPQPLAMPFYLVCDVSGSAETYLHALSQNLGRMRRALAAEPLVDDIARMCVISFADSAEIVLPMGSTGRPVPPLKGAAEGANYGAAFSFLGKAIRNDIVRFREGNYKVYRPCVFFLTAGAPRDRHWVAAFKRTLTFNPRNREGMEEYPIFIPVGTRGAPEEVLRRLAHPPDKSNWYHADQSKMEDALGAAIKTIDILPLPRIPGLQSDDRLEITDWI